MQQRVALLGRCRKLREAILEFHDWRGTSIREHDWSFYRLLILSGQELADSLSFGAMQGEIRYAADKVNPPPSEAALFRLSKSSRSPCPLKPRNAPSGGFDEF